MARFGSSSRSGWRSVSNIHALPQPAFSGQRDRYKIKLRNAGYRLVYEAD